MPKFLRPGDLQGGTWAKLAALLGVAAALLLVPLHYRGSLPLGSISICRGESQQVNGTTADAAAGSPGGICPPPAACPPPAECQCNLTSGSDPKQHASPEAAAAEVTTAASGKPEPTAAAEPGAAAAGDAAGGSSAAPAGAAGGSGSAHSWRGTYDLTYEFDLTPRELQRGIVMWGDTSRARRAMARLLEGKPLRMATVGGSITKGHNAHVWGKTDYSGRVFHWVRKAFPNVTHDLLNGAIGAIQSTYFALCLEWHIPDNVDIVVLENNVNDGDAPPNHFVRRGHERLIRKVLGLPSRPALLELTCYVYPNEQQWQEHDYAYRLGGADEMGVFAQFYRLPWISTRSLVWGGTRQTALDPKVAASARFEPMWDGDLQHPTDLGHKWIADMIVYWMQQTLEGLERQPLEAEDEAYVQAPLSMPLYKDNWEAGTHTCIMAALFRDAVVEHDKAFQWMSEGNPEKPKYGYVSAEPGSSLVFQINTNVGNKRSTQDHVTVGIGHLESYEHMGMFEATCVSGCACEPLRQDGHWDRKESQQQFARLTVSVSEACRIKVTVLNETRSGEHKVKLMGAIISETPDALHPGQAGGVRFGVADGGIKGTLNAEEGQD